LVVSAIVIVAVDVQNPATFGICIMSTGTGCPDFVHAPGLRRRIVYLHPSSVWVFPKIGVPQNGWFIMENPIEVDDLGVPLFSETSIYMQYLRVHVFVCKLICPNLPLGTRPH